MKIKKKHEIIKLECKQAIKNNLIDLRGKGVISFKEREILISHANLEELISG